MLDQITEWLSKPFTSDIPIRDLMLVVVLFICIALLSRDVLSVLKEGLS